MRNDGAEINGPEGVPQRPIDFTEPIIVNASDSFDPDDSRLRFGWELQAEPTTKSGEVARLDAWESGRLVLRDGYGNEVKHNWDLRDAFVPEVSSTTIEGKEPFGPDDTVSIQIETQRVVFQRNTASLSVGAELRGAPGRVAEWKSVSTDEENEFLFRGTVKLPASALANNDSRIVLYNEARPQMAREATSLPTIELTEAQRTERSGFRVSDVRYLIRERSVDTVDVDTRAEMIQLRNSGYHVAGTRSETTGYVLQQRVKTQNEIVQTDTRTFGSSSYRRTFLRVHPEWRQAGVRTTRTRTQETTVSWKRTRGYAFTGESRRVKTDAAEYSVEREYEYTTTELEPEKTTTRQCLPGIGCYEKTYTRLVTRKKTHTYWAQSRVSNSHSATGDVRRTLTDPAEYTTEYRHEYVSWDVDVDKTYVAEHTTVVQPARYEWQHYTTVSDEESARRLASASADVRIGSERTTRHWTMERQVTDHVVRPAYTAESMVVETRATVSGDVIRYRTSNAGFKTGKVVDEFTTEFVGRGVVGEDEIEERTRETEGSQ
ncbi:hypothetical protein [Halomarina rubra]|uniref:Uncharacterized protein n=1 Tax=Halomarina rubra TaxID=2071873 RepID=A0ABD6B1M6_9EURY|nr:hypothetical protein [Halomarina rubra]